MEEKTLTGSVTIGYTNMFQILKYPDTLNRLKIQSPVTYKEINDALGSIKDLHYHYHEKILYFLGSAEVTQKALKDRSIEYEEIPPLKINIKRDFPVMRVIIYKAFRIFLVKKGFIWDPRRRNITFLIDPKPSLTKKINEKFNIRFINTLAGMPETLNQASIDKVPMLRVHEGFKYGLDTLKNNLVLVIFPRVTPLLRVNTVSLKTGQEVVSVCYKKSCLFKGVCKLPRKKITVKEIKEVHETPKFCPEKPKFVKILDTSDKDYELPVFTIHIQPSSSAIRALGKEVYSHFRELALKKTFYRFKILQAFLYYLSEGNNQIKIQMGDDPQALIIDASPIKQSIEEEKNVWSKYSTEE